MWRVAGPSEYLAITGGSINDVKLAKKAWIWPTQKCLKFHVSPVNYTFNLRAMSAEKLPFFVPAIFTIGPRVTDHESLLLYAKLFASHIKPSSHVRDLVQGIFEGQTCLVAASMTMEHHFKEVLEKFQLELNQFGLVIYKANLVDAAKAKTKGKVAKVIKVTGAVKIFKNPKKTELAAQLAAKKDAWSRSSELAKVQEANWELYKNERMAEAQKATADATLYPRKQEDEGIQALARAQGVYVAALLKQFGSDYGAMRDYVMINWRMFHELANQSRSSEGACAEDQHLVELESD